MLVGAQGFTVRAFAQDEAGIAETMKKLAAIGYRTLQVSAFAAIPAERMRALADENGLKIVVTHTNPDRILAEPEVVAREHEIYGCKHVGIGMMPQKYVGSREGLEQFLKDFDRASRVFHEHGQKLQYHNHCFEYQKFDGAPLIDIMADETDPELWGFIVDLFWTQVGGRNPATQLRMLEGRVDVCHFKDLAIEGWDKKFAAIGEGNLCWDEIFEACRDTGVQYAMVEQDDAYGRDPFDELRISYEYLKRAGLEF